MWVACGVKPRDVWAEMDRREKMLGIAEKLPKAQRKAVESGAARSGTVALRGVIALRARRTSKRR